MDMTADQTLQESCMGALRHMGVEVTALVDKANRLEAENDRLRKERDYLLMNSNPTATELRRVRSAWKKDRDENAKLREQVVQLKDDWESERDYANQMEANEKRAASDNSKLRGENAKLRELAAEAIRLMQANGPDCGICKHYDECWTGEAMDYSPSGCVICNEARELGIEV